MTSRLAPRASRLDRPSSTRRALGWIAGLGLAALLSSYGCVATPLPTPPNAHPDRFETGEVGDGTLTVRGEPGAIEPPGANVRVTMERDPAAVGLPTRLEATSGADGAFGPLALAHFPARTYYVEVVLEDEDVFVFAFRAAGGAFEVVDPGPDRDDDGSPDEIDCAPDDPTRAGSRCP
ncbi:MAG: hypothetical protein KF729_39155 [Sandaracinaceae bacterium]|nr:hypothetical protein [Sandaracinaceae bacterium]